MKRATATGRAGRPRSISSKNSSAHERDASKLAKSKSRSSHMSEHGQFHWNELMTRDVEKAKKFYADTIGWTYDAMPMPEGGVYTLAMSSNIPVAGIFDISGP